MAAAIALGRGFAWVLFWLFPLEALEIYFGSSAFSVVWLFLTLGIGIMYTYNTYDLTLSATDNGETDAASSEVRNRARGPVDGRDEVHQPEADEPPMLPRFHPMVRPSQLSTNGLRIARPTAIAANEVSVAR